MLTLKQIKEIWEHLEKAQNPLFFFDNDNDGLTSFLLLQRYIGRGKGIAIKSFPDLEATYYRRVLELKPDYIFILDKHSVSKEFLEKVLPNIAIISCGRDNTYGHPHEEVLKNLEELGIKILSTDQDGDIKIISSRKDFVVKTKL